jgi:putative ABC transport system permease protein
VTRRGRTLPRLGLTTRALLWRRGGSLALLAVASVTTAAASLGPTYARAASESTLRDRLTTEPSDRTGLVFAATGIDVSQAPAVDQERAVAPRPGSLLGYPTSIAQVTLPSRLAPVGRLAELSRAVWREGVCAHLVIVKGRCPAAPDEVLVSSRTATGVYGFRLGGTVTLSSLTRDVLEGGDTVQQPVPLTVVGLYRARNLADPFWFGRQYFDAHPYPGSGDGPDTVDTVFVDGGLLPTLSHPTTAEVDLDYPLQPDQVRLADETTLRREVTSARQQYASGGPTLATSLGAVLDAADHERSLLQVSTLLVTVQLALLAWLVLFQVMGDAAEARGNEIALAKLRGLRPRSTLAFGLGEPLAVLALAVPIGVFGAWLVTGVMAHLVLGPGTPAVLTWGSLAGAAIGFAGGAAAAALAARRVLTRPVLEQWRRVAPQRGEGVGALVADLLLVAAAVGGLVLLRRSLTGQSEPRALALLAPGLVVLAVAVIGVRILPLLGRAALPPTRASARVGAFLAVRQVVRRPAGLRLAALLAMAIGLATFAVYGEAVAVSNRQTRAGLEVGASEVLDVQYQPGADPQRITRTVDPDGRWAMAAATWLPAGGPVTGTVVAVDSARLAAVANWPTVRSGGSGAVPAATASASAVGALLGPPVPAPVEFSGTSLRLSATSLARGPGPPPGVLVTVTPGERQPVQVLLGDLVPGTATYVGAVPCASGCTLLRVQMDRPIDFFGVLRGTVLLGSVQALAGGSWQPVDTGFTRADQWRPGGPAASTSDQLTVSPAGLRDQYVSTSGYSPGVEHIDSPIPIPVVATAQGLRRDPGANPQVLQDETGTTAAYVERLTMGLVPRAGNDGVLVDLSFVRAEQPNFPNEANWQVWLSPAAPADAVQRLAAAGLLVQDIHTQQQRQTQLGRQGPALALVLLTACAVAAALLAAGATALAVAVTGRRRAYELAALRAVGVSRASLQRSCVGEQLMLLGTGLVLGVPAGLVAAHLALPSIPEYSDATAIPLDFSLPAAALAVFVVAVALLLVVTAVVAGRVLMAHAVPSRLREVAQ